METWLLANWSQILTITLLAGSWVYQMGVSKARYEALTEKVDTFEEAMAKMVNSLNDHHKDHERHISPGFVSMCNDRHDSILRDVSETKAGVHRIESILMDAAKKK